MDRLAFPSCCGIAVVCNLARNPADDEVTFQYNMLQTIGGPNRGQLTLIAVNEDQNTRWGPVLLEKGWKLMSRHRNGGHEEPRGRNNYLYGFHPGQEDPDQFENYGDRVVVDGLPEVRLVETEIYAHLRDFGRRGPFAGLEQARLSYPHCRQFDRREIMSDGTTVWVEDV